MKTTNAKFCYLTIVFIALISMWCTSFADEKTKNPSDRPLAWARQQVLMLNDLYQTTDGLIVDRYVHDPATVSAASTIKAIFTEMKSKGWHEARLIGLTDQVFNDENKPQDEFEREAANKLQNGAASYEKVIKIKGRRFLRVALPMTASKPRCANCHSDFRDNTGNVGALVYKVALPK